MKPHDLVGRENFSFFCFVLLDMSSANAIVSSSQAMYAKVAALLPSSAPFPLKALFWVLLAWNINVSVLLLAW